MTMENKTYLMIQNNVVVNICLWNGDINTWQPPQDTIMLLLENTPSKIWGVNEELKDYILVDSIGDAGIGFSWDGAFAVTNEPKPEYIHPDGDIPTTIIE